MVYTWRYVDISTYEPSLPRSLSRKLDISAEEIRPEEERASAHYTLISACHGILSAQERAQKYMEEDMR